MRQADPLAGPAVVDDDIELAVAGSPAQQRDLVSAVIVDVRAGGQRSFPVGQLQDIRTLQLRNIVAVCDAGRNGR